MKFGKLILRKIIKIFATRCLILGLKCSKNRCRLGFAPDPAGGAYSALPDPLAGFGAPTSEGGEGRGEKGRGGERRGGEVKGGKGKEGGKGKGRTTAIPNFLALCSTVLCDIGHERSLYSLHK